MCSIDAIHNVMGYPSVIIDMGTVICSIDAIHNVMEYPSVIIDMGNVFY